MVGHRLDVFITTIIQNEGTVDAKEVLSELKLQGYDEAEIVENIKLLSRINKKRLSSILTLVNISKKKEDKVEIKLYSQNEVYEFFQSSDEQINKLYKISDLKAMYRTIYDSDPRKEMKKQELIDSIRYRFRILNRASYFNDNKTE